MVLQETVSREIVVEYRRKSSEVPEKKDKDRYSMLIRKKNGKSTKEEKWRYGPMDSIV
ncbi:MAG: hypothetical protein NC318_00615 [Blautia sp.]|nr:hypothetical protein [Lachnoclostridium sp.]MCM1210089.1 hypothetical protein [Blautia sp.]